MGGAASEMDPTRANFDKDEHVERVEKQGFDGEKVARQQLVFVMCHQVTPTG